MEDLQTNSRQRVGRAATRFAAKLDKLKKEKAPEDPIYYGDGVHSMHNSIATFGWILRGFEKPLRTNTGRKQLNINGFLNVRTQKNIL